MTEQKIQSKIKTALEQEGAYVIKVVQASKKGVPDLIACYKGYFLGIEVKKPTTTGDTSKLQKYNLKLIAEAKGLSCVACSFECVEPLLRRIDGFLHKV